MSNINPLFNNILKPFSPPKECDGCEGTGKDFFSCCGVDMRGRDFDNCPACKEHTGWDGLGNADNCQECNGTGEELKLKK